MSKTGTADIPEAFDLRQAFAAIGSRAGSSAGEGGEADSAPPAGSPPPANAGAEEDGADLGTQLSEEEIKSPRIKQLSDEAGRYRHTAKAEKERADGAEERANELETALREAHMFNAFLLASNGQVADADAAWKLAEKSEVTIDDDGKVSGMDEVVAATLQRYPYLSPKPVEEPGSLADKFPALQPSGRQTNGKAKPKDGLNRRALESKFPALGRRGAH